MTPQQPSRSGIRNGTVEPSWALELRELGVWPPPQQSDIPLYRHPSKASLRGYQYLRNVGGRAESQYLLRKALGMRGRLPEGLQEVARCCFAGTRELLEVQPGTWALTLAPELRDALYERRFVVFDLETTGGKPPTERITEIGAVRIEGGELIEEFQTLVNPGKPIPPFVARLTGITNKMVRRAPKIERVLPRFLDFIDGSVLVAHDVFQDLRFIDQELMTLYGGVLAMPVVDTLVLAKELIDPEIGFSLRKVAEHLEIAETANHRALDDAIVTAQLLLRFMEIKPRGSWDRLLDGYADEPEGG